MPHSLEELDGFLRDPNFVHLGQSTDDSREQIYHGLVGPANARSAVFAFMTIIAWLNITAPIFVDGTMKVVKHVIREQVTQLLVVLTNYNDHVSSICMNFLVLCVCS